MTAPELSSLFGRVLGRQCAHLLRAIGASDILELGAGTGRLCVDVLKSMHSANAGPARYRILEVSPDLIERQRALVQAEVPAAAASVCWIDRLPDDFAGIILANEVLDALPVERFVKRNRDLMQLRVKRQGDGFAWCEAPAPEFLLRAVREIEASLDEPLADGYVSEVATGLSGWIGDLATHLDRGLVLLIDYGLPRHEYYAPDRTGGWLRCHYRHHAHDDPLVLTGIQDITAWVDFTAVAIAAVAAGLRVAGFVTQSRFLLDGGLQEELAGFDRLPTAAQIDLARQVRMLTMPGEMGEHCKCIGLARGRVETPVALRLGDRAHGL